MSDTDHYAIIDAIGEAAASVVDGLKRSDFILDPKTSPNTRLHKVYSVNVQTQNTGKYRDHRDRRMRLDAEVTLVCAWRMNPKREQVTTQRMALRDEDNAVQAVLTDDRDPLPSCRVLYRRSRRSMSPTREWLFSSITFSVEFDRSLTAEVL